MKKIISVFICFAFLFSFSLIASAEGKVIVSFVPSVATVHQNELFSVVVEFDNATSYDIYVAQMSIVFDNKKLDFLSISPKLSNFVGGSDGEINVNQADNTIIIVYMDNDLNSPLPKNEKAIFSLNFKVKSNATIGDISFSNLSTQETSILSLIGTKKDEKDLPYDVISKTMKIVGGTAPATTTTVSTTAKTIAGETTTASTKEIIITAGVDTPTGITGNTTITNATDSNGKTIIATATTTDKGTTDSGNTALIIIIITAIIVLIGAGIIFFMIKHKNKNIE